MHNLPLCLKKDNQEYYLYLEFRRSRENTWIWKATYVGDHGILVSEEDVTLHNVEEKVNQFIELNSILPCYE